MPAYARVIYVIQMKSETDYDLVGAQRSTAETDDPDLSGTGVGVPRWTGDEFPTILTDITGNL